MELTAPISPSAARTLVAAFNGGFRYCSGGGYYSEGRLVCPLAQGGASFVIYRNGDATVGAWGRDVSMSKQVIAVRQDVTLLVDGGQAVAGLNPYDTSVWGFTLGGIPNVWRAGVGVTANGALVYAYGPDMEVTQLAELLVRARTVRAMTLDINPDWTVFVTYKLLPVRRPPQRTGVHSSQAPSRARRPSSTHPGAVTSSPCLLAKSAMAQGRPPGERSLSRSPCWATRPKKYRLQEDFRVPSGRGRLAMRKGSWPQTSRRSLPLLGPGGTNERSGAVHGIVAVLGSYQLVVESRFPRRRQRGVRVI